MNEVKFKANKKDLEAIGGEIQEATAALDTADATAGQVLTVETPGEAPVWGEAGGGGVTINVGQKIFNYSNNEYHLNDVARGMVDYYEYNQNTQPIMTGDWKHTVLNTPAVIFTLQGFTFLDTMTVKQYQSYSDYAYISHTITRISAINSSYDARSLLVEKKVYWVCVTQS